MAKKNSTQKSAAPNRPGDVALNQEWLLGVMNLAAIEEHLAFSIAKTQKPVYGGFLAAVRRLRSRHLKKLASNTEGENWCVAKHLLLASKHFEETAVKLAEDPKRKKDALELWRDAGELLQSFWVLQELGLKKNSVRKNEKIGRNAKIRSEKIARRENE